MLAILSALVFVAAQAAPPDVPTIVQRHLTAVGGAALRGMTSWRISGTITTPDGRVFRFRSERKRPNLCRWEDVAPDGAARTKGYNGRVAWAVDRSGVRILHGEEERERRQTCEFDESPLLDYAKRGIAVTNQGVVDLGTAKAYKLDTRAPGGNRRIVYLDTVTFLDVRIDYIDSDGTVTVQELRDRRTVSGVSTATTWIMTDEAGQDPMTSHADAIEVNVELAQERFDPPRQ